MSADDEITIRCLPVDTLANAVEAMRHQPSGMTAEQWLALVDAGVLPACAENVHVEPSRGPDPQSWVVRARWVEFPGASE